MDCGGLWELISYIPGSYFTSEANGEVGNIMFISTRIRISQGQLSRIYPVLLALELLGLGKEQGRALVW